LGVHGKGRKTKYRWAVTIREKGEEELKEEGERLQKHVKARDSRRGRSGKDAGFSKGGGKLTK